MLFVVPVFSEENKFKTTYQDFAVHHGQAHYSWLLVFKRICKSLESASIPYRVLTRPEIYSSDIAKKVLLGKDTSSTIHVLHVRPIELIRIMPGAVNACYYLWEYEQIPDEWLADNPYYDFRNQLSLLDHIYTANSTFERFLKTQNFSSVSTLYLPLAERSVAPCQAKLSKRYNGCIISEYDKTGLESNQDHTNAFAVACKLDQENLSTFIERERDKGSLILLTVANPWDRRKNIVNLIKALADLTLNGRSVALILKSVLIDVEPWNAIAHLLVNVYGIMDLRVSNSIWITSDYFDEADLDLLYQSVDAYLCTSSCEGLNLPLFDAIRNRCPVITPLHSAMSGYLDPQSCFTVAYHTALAEPEASCLGQSSKLYWNQPQVKHIQASIISFMESTTASKEAKTRNAFTHISSTYNLSHFASSIHSLIDP